MGIPGAACMLLKVVAPMSKAPTSHNMGAVSQQEVHPNNNPCSPNSAPQEIWRTWAGEIETIPQEQWAHVAANRYARHGLKVGILNGKIPMTSHGFKDFTTNLEQINAWWGTYPGANIGATPPKGVVVIDIDPRNGGHETWEALTRYRELPETLLVRTGSGGHHFWYRLPHEGAIRGELGKGIDLKTHTGYLVMPPSIHPTTGERYTISWWADIAVLPTWLNEYVYKPTPRPTQSMQARREGDNAGGGLVETVERAPEGQRNSALYWAACRNVDEGLGLDEELVAAALVCGLSEREARQAIASAQRKDVA